MRQEGVFSAAISFSTKATTGAGLVLSGLVLDYAIGLPAGAEPSSLNDQLIRRMGIIVGILIPLLYLLPFYRATKYEISRRRHSEIRQSLEQRRTRG